MEFIVTTEYDQKSMTAMARALRKTVRKSHSRRSRIFGGIAVVLGLLLSLGDLHFSAKTVLTWLAILAILVVFLWEDPINGYFARKRSLPGMRTSTTTFTPDGYRSVTQLGTSDFSYSAIAALAETKNYFVLIFSQSHAQVYDKTSLIGGTAADLRTLLREKTGLEITPV